MIGFQGGEIQWKTVYKSWKIDEIQNDRVENNDQVQAMIEGG